MERKNINRGFRKLEVWNDAVELYVLTCMIFTKLPRHHMKISSNAIDASQSISRNIAEGYCRKSINEYINFLYYSLGSCGELFTCFHSCMLSETISQSDYENLDALHYKVENKLIKLVESLEKKRNAGDWNTSLTGIHSPIHPSINPSIH